MSVALSSPTKCTPILSLGDSLPKISRQIEFYFGDLNLPKDKFLLTKISETADGWVPISIIADFSRIKVHLGNINTEQEKYAAIKAALVSSSIVEVNEDGTALRRKKALSITRDDLKASLYVKGFPKNASLDDLQHFFKTLSDAPFAVRMRRLQGIDKSFKGSVYVEFLTEAEIDPILTLDPYPSFIDENNISHTLIFQRKIDHVMKKNRDNKNDASSSLNKIHKDSIVKISPIPQDADWKLIKDTLSTKVSVSRVIVDSDNQVAFALLRDSEDLQSESSNLASQAIQKCPCIAFGTLDSTLSTLSDSEYEMAIVSFKSVLGKPSNSITFKRTKFSKRQKMN